MSTRSYALDRGGEKRVQVSWSGHWKNLTVQVDGNLVGAVASQKELKAGRDFDLADGSTLRVQLGGGYLVKDLQIFRDGKPLPGTTSDPAKRLSTAYGILLFIGGLNLILGLAAEVTRSPLLQGLGLGGISAGVGLIYLVLAFFVRRRSTPALAVALTLMIVDSAMTIADIGPRDAGAIAGALSMRIFFILYLYRGLGAIRALKREDAEAVPGPAPA